MLVPWALPFCAKGTAPHYVVCCVLLHVLCHEHCRFVPKALLLHMLHAVYCCMFVLWALLLHMLYAVYCCVFCVMGTAASYVVCCVLPQVCAMGTTASVWYSGGSRGGHVPPSFFLIPYLIATTLTAN